jgi:hypothetical protein
MLQRKILSGPGQIEPPLYPPSAMWIGAGMTAVGFGWALIAVMLG